MLWEIEGKFWTDWDTIEFSAGELRSIRNLSDLNDHYFRTFDGSEAFTSKIREATLEGSPFESTLEYWEEWGQFDYQGEVSISNDADGFSFDEVDFGRLTMIPDDEILELRVRYYSGFRVTVAAESKEEAILIVNESGPVMFVVEDASENEWEIKEVEIEYLEELE
jgi:hypothetical protein